MRFLSDPAFWASLSGVLIAIGVEFGLPGEFFEHLMAAIGGIAGIIGIVFGLAEAGHRIRYEHRSEPTRESIVDQVKP